MDPSLTPAVEARGLRYAYGRRDVLHDLDLTVPAGAIYALLGANGSGKTTLLQLLAGLRCPSAGTVRVLGEDARSSGIDARRRIAYVAEGRPLPGWMTLEYLERYLAPLYPSWDRALAASLRERFALDPRRKVGTLSRGEHMKAALLCALAPRPRLLLMDEPFTGMDALVKDDLVRGLLESAGSEGWTVLVSSHDIGELDLLADHVGFLARGALRVSEPMERLRARFRRVTVVGDDAALAARPDDRWMAVDRAARRLTFFAPDAGADYETSRLPARFPTAERVEAREASLREVFVALAQDARGAAGSATEREVAA